jgi:TatD DNase family protein
MAIFFDTHAHLDYQDFELDLDGVIANAETVGITKIISIGTDLESSRRAIDLADRFPSVFAVVGWHPSHAQQAPPDIRSELRSLARHPKVVALGETGLDYHHLPSEKSGSNAEDEQYKQKQLELFQQHLEVASEMSLNCVIHQRDALEDVLLEMSNYASRVRGVFHCFVDGSAAMQRIRALGSIVSFTGIVSFKNAQNVRDTLAATPLGQFMLETDCPYLAPVPYRGKRCEPAHVKEIAEVAVRVKGCTEDELSAATCETAHRFFPKLS